MTKISETGIRRTALALGGAGADAVPVDSDNPVPVTIAAIGSPDDAPWNGTDPAASAISLLKAIALNTTP